MLENPEYETLVCRLKEFSAGLGEAPRLLVDKLGQDGHDRGAKIIASAFGTSGSMSLPARFSRRRRKPQALLSGRKSTSSESRRLRPGIIPWSPK